ncbi:MAG: hypothetical protein FJZ16_06330 [Candidatus Omnitrophica bacterium]|nr:hypothetical protein [Candidatus Omnitrophota bacterium]
MHFAPRLSASAIGSMPHADVKEAVDFVLTHFKEIPCWPQLPKKSYYENMYVQFSQAMPNVVVDKEQKRIFINTEKNLEEKLEVFYSKYLEGDLGYFSIGEDFASGLYEFKRRFLTSGIKDTRYIKGQIVGPISFGLTVCDQIRQSVYYNEQILDVIIKMLSLKAKWQIRFLKELKKEIVIFLDEPYLTSVGSAYVAINRDKLISNLNEIIDVIHAEGAISGIHCCGNTDWSIVASTKTDIISFDAYNYADTVLLYPDSISKFMERQGVLAWGIVPTDSNALKENKDSLSKNIEGWVNKLKEKGIKRDTIINQSMITPSCGTGSLDEELSEHILLLTTSLSDFIRTRYL